jgi:hypothetical protein
MKKIFSGKTAELESMIESYLDGVGKSALLFNEAVKDYIAHNHARFNRQLQEITELENAADKLRHDIKYRLYRFMLIPESRGDVLGLIENLDNVVDLAKKTIAHFSIEKPNIPDFLAYDFIELAELSCKAVEQIVGGTRAFFNAVKLVNDYINKVHFYEHEADKVEEGLKRKIFNSDQIPDLSQKLHLAYFTTRIAKPSDEAESVGERLSVYAIKRSV